jgi:hypothetical protein
MRARTNDALNLAALTWALVFVSAQVMDASDKRQGQRPGRRPGYCA